VLKNPVPFATTLLCQVLNWKKSHTGKFDIEFTTVKEMHQKKKRILPQECWDLEALNL